MRCNAEELDTDDGIQLTIHDSRAEFSVYLHASGDHIVIRYHVNKDGGEYPAVLPHGSWAWDRAVARAMTGSAFL